MTLGESGIALRLVDLSREIPWNDLNELRPLGNNGSKAGRGLRCAVELLRR